MTYPTRILRTPDVYCGVNSFHKLPQILKQIQATSVLFITGSSSVQSGALKKITELLKENDIFSYCYSKVLAEPTIEQLEDMLKECREYNVQAVVGLGGGSAVDAAKVAAALFTNRGSVCDYIGIDTIVNVPLPIIAVPTTAGTGSETTQISIVTDNNQQLKRAIVSEKIIPNFAVLDPSLTLTKPPKLTAATGMDALIHALEAYVARNASVYSDTFALKAIELISRNILTAYREGSNIKARENMLLGSYMAGIAFANAGVGAVHAFAYPLGGMYGIPHGIANSVMLPTLMRFNIVGSEERFAILASKLTGDENTSPSDSVAYVSFLCKELDIPSGLKELGICRSSLDDLASGAMNVTRLLENNPRTINYEDAICIYEDAF
ncbi:iron-containing alcohol dehydrogenase [Vibrio rhodolitus]|uniref:iron-containing alcohol dehydrogenase n=1 Tax=Vibrio rhodolitus TaxID=2231649 RepID=UPI000E0AFD97|nr:iron-containing alcohol dehydrogenase [Vibrio rhodolitus]